MKSKTQKQTRTLTIQSDVRYGMNYLFKEIPKLIIPHKFSHRSDGNWATHFLSTPFFQTTG